MKISNFFRIPSLCALASCFLATAAYDIACIYPEKWTRNLFDALQFGRFFGDFMKEYKIETPVVVRSSHHATMCRAMCLSLHDPNVLDPYEEMPTWTVPSFGQNGYSTVMCIGQCALYVFENFFDFNDLAIEFWSDEFGLEYTKPETRSDIHNAWMDYMDTNNEEQMLEIMMEYDYHPYTMGHIAGWFVKYHADMDGWNDMGSLSWDHEDMMAVPCTASCREFQDTVGYNPVVDPRDYPPPMGGDESKYDCTGDCRRWQPLQEGDDAGNLKEQEFVVPHIGSKAKTYLRNSTLTLSDPEYDLYDESMQVVERLKEVSSNIYMKDAVRYFDDKLLVRNSITTSVRNQFSDMHSFQDEILSLVGISTAEYDGVVQAWHEKWAHDLVRPTTVIKHWGDDDLYTYGGDDMLSGPVTIKARDFEAYIRVMPHPEFPSGSSCLCTAYQEFTDIYMNNKYMDTVKDIRWSVDERSYVLADMEELRYVCGVSRLWGGMHYPAAIPAGEDICSGLGQLAYDYVERLRNGAIFEVDYELGECTE